MVFHDAQTYCRQHHTDLASVIDAQEYSILQQTVTSDSWVGLFRDLWKWSDQTNFSNINWGQDPWSVVMTDNCGSISNGLVYPTQCSEIMPFFCLSGELKLCSGTYFSLVSMAFKMQVKFCICFCVQILQKNKA